jgi:hypothetical protein
MAVANYLAYKYRAMYASMAVKMVDRVEEDARKTGCRNWAAAAQDRVRWRHLLEEAKTHPGL